ncbi:unnamed protein product [Oncorhynchus mykiss]|uniref:LRRCT domain-containing protein n=1 Tax=Oncorhynchus mykiss TaxID=8022 RepID=A0A060WIB2_ONCMY|nr:unnamed protein product [Oncorhynchus mykiss]
MTGLSSCHKPISVFPALMCALSLCHSTMAAYLWLVLAIVSDVAASLLRPPRQLSPCQMVQNDVYCNDLNLRTVPAKLPHGIQKLDLSRNLLQNITQEVLAIYTTVHHLNLHSNKIQFIQPGLFKDMTNLQVLDLSSNYLDVFAETFCGALALRNIDLHNNVILEIEDGAFDSLLHLSELDLSINSITCITDFNLSKLKVLNLSKNSMECFQTTDSDLEYELLHLDLRENNIHYFPVLPRRNKLMYLDLSRNHLMSVNTTGTADELEHFRDTLKYLNMSYNQIKSIPMSYFCSMVSLVHLNVSNNCIGAFSIDQESPLNSLKTLDLRNFLTIMDSGMFQRLPSIRGLHLQQNYLKVCPSQRKSPQTDHNSQDPPGCVSFTSIPSLHLLYLSGNNLEVLPPYAFNGTPLRLLDLSLNPGLEIHQNAFSSLETSLTNLSLRENHIPELNTDLSLLSSLKFVDLSTNKLTTLPLWNKASSIESLNLQNNNLVTLEYNTVLVLERTLKTLYMGSNPLSCCSNPRFLNMLQHSDVVIPDIAIVTCQYTENSEPVEVNVGSVTQEQCQKLDSKSVSIIVIVVTALVLIAVLVVLSKVCHPKRRKLNISFRA